MLLVFCFLSFAFGQCTSPLELELVADGSGSITAIDWQTALSFFSSFAQSLNVSSSGSHVGFVQFSSVAQIEQTLTGDLTKLLNVINTTQQMGQQTAIGSGLKVAQGDLIANGRANVSQVVVLVTDGQNNSGPDPVPIAQGLRDAGVIIIGLGVGPQANMTALAALCSGSQFVFSSGSWQNVSSLVQKLSSTACSTTTVTSTTSTSSPTTTPIASSPTPVILDPSVALIVYSVNQTASCKNAISSLGLYCDIQDNCIGGNYANVTNCQGLTAQVFQTLSQSNPSLIFEIRQISDTFIATQTQYGVPYSISLKSSLNLPTGSNVAANFAFPDTVTCVQGTPWLNNGTSSVCTSVLLCRSQQESILYNPYIFTSYCGIMAFENPILYSHVTFIVESTPGQKKN